MNVSHGVEVPKNCSSGKINCCNFRSKLLIRDNYEVFLGLMRESFFTNKQETTLDDKEFLKKYISGSKTLKSLNLTTIHGKLFSINMLEAKSYKRCHFRITKQPPWYDYLLRYDLRPFKSRFNINFW